MQGAGKMGPVAGLFSEVQDEVLADCVFEEMVRKDNPGLVKLNGQANLGSAVHVDGSWADGVALDAEAMGLAREASGGAAATTPPLVASFVRGPAGWSMSPGRRASVGDGSGDGCSPPSRVPPAELLMGGPFNGCNPKCRRVIQMYRHELAELTDSLDAGTKEVCSKEEKIAQRDRSIRKLRELLKRALSCRSCGRHVTLHDLMPS